MTHIHVAGEIHVDPAARAPHWLSVPTDVNELLPKLWSANARKDADGVLHVAGLDVDEIAREVGTPAYVLDAADLKARARAFAEAFAGWRVYYAGKSFLCTTVARWVAAEGLGVDVCSGGELAVALRAGVDPTVIGLHGNNKSEEELRTGLAAGVGRIIVDSFDEIARLDRLARYLEVRPRVMVRVTTGVEAHTHEFIATAHEDQKFGFSIAGGQAAGALMACHESDVLELIGIHSHIGSQIFDTEGFEVAARRTLRLQADFAARTGVDTARARSRRRLRHRLHQCRHPFTPAVLAAAMRTIVEGECASLDIACRSSRSSRAERSAGRARSRCIASAP